MLDLGLTSTEQDAFHDALVSSHRIRTKVHILNRDEKHIDSLSEPVNRVLSGSVQVDASADVTRSLDLTILDPDRKLRFEANNPAHGAVYADRFIHVDYEVWVEDVIGDWVKVPVFWGPVTGFSRAGAEVSIEAQGKESLLLDPHFAVQGYEIRKRTRLDDAIEKVARKAGERRFDLPRLSHKLHNKRSVLDQSQPWLILKGGDVDSKGKTLPGLVSKSPHGERQIYYNGRGELTVRRLNQRSIFTFRSLWEGERNHLTSRPNISYDLEAFKNYVTVKGGKPKGKSPANGFATLAASHPLSPKALSRNDQPRYLAQFEEADGLDTNKKCEDRAKEILQRLSKEGVEVTFDCLPVPHLEENDRVTLRTSEYEVEFELKQFTIPLASDESMSVGTLKHVSKVRRTKRHHHGHHGGHHIRTGHQRQHSTRHHGKGKHHKRKHRH